MLHFEGPRAQKLKQMCQVLSTWATEGVWSRPPPTLFQRHLWNIHLTSDTFLILHVCLAGGKLQKKNGIAWSSVVSGMERKGWIVDTEEVTNEICRGREGRDRVFPRLWVPIKATEMKKKEPWILTHFVCFSLISDMTFLPCFFHL